MSPPRCRGGWQANEGWCGDRAPAGSRRTAGLAGSPAAAAWPTAAGPSQAPAGPAGGQGRVSLLLLRPLRRHVLVPALLLVHVVIGVVGVEAAVRAAGRSEVCVREWLSLWVRGWVGARGAGGSGWNTAARAGRPGTRTDPGPAPPRTAGTRGRRAGPRPAARARPAGCAAQSSPAPGRGGSRRVGMAGGGWWAGGESGTGGQSKPTAAQLRGHCFIPAGAARSGISHRHSPTCRQPTPTTPAGSARAAPRRPRPRRAGGGCTAAPRGPGAAPACGPPPCCEPGVDGQGGAGQRGGEGMRSGHAGAEPRCAASAGQSQAGCSASGAPPTHPALGHAPT